MDDQFLHDLRRKPSPGFARQLRVALEERERMPRLGLFGPVATRWISAAASVAIVAMTFSIPAVRAGAQSFLDLFRIVQFTAVSFDASRFEQISFEGLDIAAMVGAQPDSAEYEPMPVSYSSVDEASAAAGFEILEPAWLPVGWSRSGLEVTNAHGFDFVARTALLDVVLEQLAIDDVSVPPALEGAMVSVNIPSTAHSTFSMGDRTIRLVQATSPEFSLPGDIEPAELAEIGLRILGLDRDEAYRLAWTIDWRSTLLVPVPAADASFREVTVGGSDGLLIEPHGENTGSMLLWGTDDQVFALAGDLPPAQLQTVAQTAQ